MKIAHIINPVNVTEKSDLFIAQPITFETMRRAKEYANDNEINIELFYTCYEEDLSIAPEGFTQTKLLEKSILDYKDFEKKRKLPLIKDILDRLYESSDADYFIYTNVDIAVMLHFYTEVKTIIDKGYDGFVINRRTIDKKYTSIAEIHEMYSEIGEKHPGFDCFVFKRDAYLNYELSTACIGANWIGRVIISNLILNCINFKVFVDKHLTFHIGDDRSWKISEFNDYDKNNEESLIRLLQKKVNDISNINNDELNKIVNFHVSPKSNKRDKKINLEKFSNKENIFYKLFSKKNESPLNQEPIFIVGFPRSGTTFLLSKMISQKNIHSLPETHYFDIVSQNLNYTKGKEIITKINRWTPLSDDAKKFIEHCAKNSSLNKKSLFEIIIIDYLLKQVSAADLYKVRWIEKTPDHSIYLNEIKELYPKAKFVYILRNPIASFNSWRRVAHQWGGSHKSAEEYSKMWEYRLSKSLSFKQKNMNQLMFIKLENLRENLSLELKKIFQFIHTSFEPKLLTVENNKSKFLVLGNETWKQEAVGGKVERSDKIADTDLRFFEELRVLLYLKNYLKIFHYKNVLSKNYYQNELIQQDEVESYIMSDENNAAIQSVATSNNQSSSELIAELKNLATIKFFKNPVKKYKAYKIMLKKFHTLEG